VQADYGSLIARKACEGRADPGAGLLRQERAIGSPFGRERLAGACEQGVLQDFLGERPLVHVSHRDPQQGGAPSRQCRREPRQSGH
jgi:hypothetical protein